jgi:A1 cistron-splicing factor AAR2
LIRYYDPTAEDFKSHHDPSIEHTITSLDYIKSIDSQLAPYPMKDYDRWKTLTNYITLDHVSSMIGFNHQEDSLLDSLITNHLNLSKHPPPPLSNNLTHRTQWGKPRKLSPDHDSSKSELTHQPTTHWPFIDLNRSWPKDAIGPQLTKWSRDKSWLFNHLMHHQFKNGQFLEK